MLMDLTTLISKGLIGPLNSPQAGPAVFPYELGTRGLHEVVEGAYGDMAAATGFVLSASRPAQQGTLLWISQASWRRDAGSPPETALRELAGRNTRRLNLVARQASDVLWATEEAIISGAVSHVIAEVNTADFTATRRLVLASARYGVPVTLILPYGREGATAAATRWRIAARPSAPNSYDPRAIGRARWRASLERCRLSPSSAGRTFDLEWNDETLSLSVVSGMVAGPAAPRTTSVHAHPDRKAG